MSVLQAGKELGLEMLLPRALEQAWIVIMLDADDVYGCVLCELYGLTPPRTAF